MIGVFNTLKKKKKKKLKDKWLSKNKNNFKRIKRKIHKYKQFLLRIKN